MTTCVTDNTLQQQLAEIAGLDTLEDWSIFDAREDRGLYLLHSEIGTKRPDLPRGLVVDLPNRTVVCKSFGFTPTATVSQLIPQALTGDLCLIDEFISKHAFKNGRYRIKPAYEGVILRVFKHQDTVYFCTHKKLDASKSRWGSSDRFLDMYHRLGGPSAEDLFLPETHYSQWCYVFLLVDPALLVATKQPVGPGYLVDLGAFPMWEPFPPEKCPYKLKEDQEDLRPYAGILEASPRVLEAEEQCPSLVCHPFLLRPKDLSLEKANEFLRTGYIPLRPGPKREFEEQVLGWGESVMIYGLDEQEHITDVLRVYSPGYAFRIKMRGDMANIKYRFYQLATEMYEEPTSVSDFLKKFPVPYRVSARGNEVQITVGTQLWTLDLSQRDHRLYLIYLSYFSSLPWPAQEKASGLCEEFFEARENLLGWIQQLSLDRTQENNEDLSERLREILKVTRRFAQQRRREHRDRNRYGKRMSFTALIQANIRNLILKESGPSLYRLMREMRKILTPPSPALPEKEKE